MRFPSYRSRLGGIRTVFIDNYNRILKVDHPQTKKEAETERAVGWIVVTLVQVGVTELFTELDSPSYRVSKLRWSDCCLHHMRRN
jgi:hypothetical protein